jgi:hypothetical protein
VEPGALHLSIGEGDSMKRSWTALAVSLFALGVLAGCNDYNNSVQYDTGATLLSISPSAMAAGTPTTGTLANCPNTPTGQTNPCFTLFVQAALLNGFVAQTVVEWNGQKMPTTIIDSSNVSAQIPYSLIAKPGTAYVNTFQPQSGSGTNGLSNSLSFIIYGSANPPPTLASVSPTTAALCPGKCADVPITLAGSNFLPTTQNGGSSVTYTGAATGGIETAITVNGISSTQIKATIPGTYLSTADTAKINVINPPSAICVVNCPNLGGGDTNCAGAQAGSGCVPSTQTFTVGAGSGAMATSAALAVAEEAPSVSQDGRYVTYASMQNDKAQILLRDTCLGAADGCTPATRVVSVSTDGTPGNGDSHNAVMTPDGRYVAFSSAASNLLENAPSGRQVYLRDTCIGVSGACKPSTTLASIDEEGKLGGSEAILPSISTSGRFVAFLAVTQSHTAAASSGNTTHANMVALPNSGLRQVFVRDTCLGAANCAPQTTRISLDPGDAPADTSKPVGPALAGLAKQIALANGKSSTVFAPTVAIDDRVFLAIPNETK